jgi:hypothetical protein
MFGNMLLSTGQPVQAMLVPDAALSTDQARKIVMVANKDGSLTPHPVTTGPVVDGLRVIRTGLAPTDRVVIAGAQLVLPGMKAKLQPGRIIAQATPAAPDVVPVPLSGEATFVGR